MLGLTEPTVTQYGRSDSDYEILVELPDIDDPARVKELIGTVAQLEIDEVKGQTGVTTDAVDVDDPFATFEEWSSPADDKAYAGL